MTEVPRPGPPPRVVFRGPSPAVRRFLATAFEMSLQHWVNDAAMAVFFCVIGLEITREVAQGDLRDRRTVIVPTIGAVGGLLVPIAI